MDMNRINSLIIFQTRLKLKSWTVIGSIAKKKACFFGKISLVIQIPQRD
jgi:hypothetical protein